MFRIQSSTINTNWTKFKSGVVWLVKVWGPSLLLVTVIITVLCLTSPSFMKPRVEASFPVRQSSLSVAQGSEKIQQISLQVNTDYSATADTYKQACSAAVDSNVVEENVRWQAELEASERELDVIISLILQCHDDVVRDCESHQNQPVASDVNKDSDKKVSELDNAVTDFLVELRDVGAECLNGVTSTACRVGAGSVKESMMEMLGRAQTLLAHTDENLKTKYEFYYRMGIVLFLTVRVQMDSMPSLHKWDPSQSIIDFTQVNVEARVFELTEEMINRKTADLLKTIDTETLKTKAALELYRKAPPVQAVPNWLPNPASLTGADQGNFWHEIPRKIPLRMPEEDDIRTAAGQLKAPFQSTFMEVFESWIFAHTEWIIPADYVVRAFRIANPVYRWLIRSRENFGPVEARDIVTKHPVLYWVNMVAFVFTEILSISVPVLLYGAMLVPVGPIYTEYSDNCLKSRHGTTTANNLVIIAQQYAMTNLTQTNAEIQFFVDNKAFVACNKGKTTSLAASDALQTKYQSKMGTIPYVCSDDMACANSSGLEWAVPVNDTIFKCTNLLAHCDMDKIPPPRLEDLREPIVDMVCAQEADKFSIIDQNYVVAFTYIFFNLAAWHFLRGVVEVFLAYMMSAQVNMRSDMDKLSQELVDFNKEDWCAYITDKKRRGLANGCFRMAYGFVLFLATLIVLLTWEQTMPSMIQAVRSMVGGA
jgi:hypothetical protein